MGTRPEARGAADTLDSGSPACAQSFHTSTFTWLPLPAYLRVQHEHPDLWSRVLAPGAGPGSGPRPGRSRPGPNADRVSPAPPARPAPGLSPLTLRKRCPYMGRFCPVTSARSPGRFREPPPPALPGRAAAPGRGPGFSRAGGSLGAESPRPGSRAPAAGGLRSPAPPCAPGATRAASSGLAPEPRRAHAPSLGSDPGGAELRPRCHADAVRAAPARKGGARLPVSPPVCQARSCALPGLVLSGQLFGPLGAATASVPAAPQQLRQVQSCRWLVGTRWP
ncbi:translation initiation factor IF-2-like [Peromyscus leucopus]|uniref:translation initiation factor IF-2-like n=1 Tax=Peromyscus leucopus TaxID=10041 RepID=UPI0010A1DDAB|nr:translation initiation factor IF-2-like [Peromyscus leucopus]